MLCDMGVDLEYENLCEEGGELVVDLCVKFSLNLKGIDVLLECVVLMIDEYFVLFVVVVFVVGDIVMKGVKEFCVKEFDWIDVMVKGLCVVGVDVDEGDDWWIVKGCGFGNVLGGVIVESCLDYWIVMLFMVMGMVIEKLMSVDDGLLIVILFLIFEGLMGNFGVCLECSNG